MSIETKAFIEDIYFLSLYDRKYRVPAEEEEPLLAYLVIDELNVIIQEYKNKLPFSTPLAKQITKEENKYGVIEGIKLSEVSKVQVQHDGILKNLSFCDIDTFLNKVSVSDCETIPSVYTLVPSKEELWIFPAYASTFMVWAYDFPIFQVNYTVEGNQTNTPPVPTDEPIQIDFVPSVLPYGDNLVFWKFMKYKLAQRLAESHNTTLSQEKLRTLRELEGNLLHKKEGKILSQTTPTILSETWI